MIFNENGEILNRDYLLDLVINEGFSDIVKGAQVGATKLLRKMIDAVQSAIEYISRLKFAKVIKDLKLTCDFFDIRKILPEEDSSNLNYYINSTGYGKWAENFQIACESLKAFHENKDINYEQIINILYNGNDKENFFKSKNNSDNKNIDQEYLRTIVANLGEFTNPMRKAYSNLIILNTELQKGKKIDNNIIKEMHSYCINCIYAYKNISNIILKALKFNKTKKKNDDIKIPKMNIIDDILLDKIINNIKNELNKNKDRFVKTYNEEAFFTKGSFLNNMGLGVCNNIKTIFGGYIVTIEMDVKKKLLSEYDDIFFQNKVYENSDEIRDRSILDSFKPPIKFYKSNNMNEVIDEFFISLEKYCYKFIKKLDKRAFDWYNKTKKIVDNIEKDY